MNRFEITEFINQLDEKCKKITKKEFKKADIICSYIEKRNQLCILLDGEAQLIRYDFNGNKNIIGQFYPNDIFGEVFYPVTTNNELFVVAKTDSSVLFMDYNSLQAKCTRNCHFHEVLAGNFSFLLQEKIVQMSTRVEILTKRTIRDKLLTYFDLLSHQTFSKTFRIPFSLTDLADYLSVDRSAMMRELKLLAEDGILERTNNKITLLQH